MDSRAIIKKAANDLVNVFMIFEIYCFGLKLFWCLMDRTQMTRIERLSAGKAGIIADKIRENWLHRCHL